MTRAEFMNAKEGVRKMKARCAGELAFPMHGVRSLRMIPIMATQGKLNNAFRGRG